MAVIPIEIQPEEVHIRADRRLAFQLIAALGGNGEPGAANRVLEKRSDAELLVEFNTPIQAFGFTKTFRTVEWVRLTPPEQIDFNLIPGRGPITGGLKLLRDRFVLEDTGGCTNLRYESTFGIRWSIWGWMVGNLLVKGLLKKHMREHLGSLRETIEARAARSRVFPQTACPHGGAVQGVAQ